MKMIIFKDDRIAINIDRIDAIAPSRNNSEHTVIFVSGSEHPFYISDTFESVITKIYNENKYE